MSLILILDDRGTNRKILAQLAVSVEPSAEVVTFGNPLLALAWMDGHQPDLVISDYRMPHLDGAEVAGRIRAKATGADVPIIVVTAYNDPVFRLRALEAGATDFLVSPVDHAEFRTRVRNLLALRRHQLQARRQVQALARDLEASERSRHALLRESRESLAQLIDTVPAMISATDRAGKLIFVNARQATIAGSTPAELVGHGALRILGQARLERGLAADAEVFASGLPMAGFEEELSDGQGGSRTLLTTKAPLRDGEGRVTAVVTTSIDITDRKRAEEQLLYLARHDALTGLPNRSMLGERLRDRCAQGRQDGRQPPRPGGRRGEAAFALHILDLDRFKAVNDALGHEAGDRMLRDVAARLTEAVGPDHLVARLGGDEFAILQAEIGAAQEAAQLALRVQEALERPFTVLGRSVQVAVSIGVALFPGDATSAEELLRHADLAMSRAKSEGGKGYCFFDPAMDHAAREAMQLEADLRGALARGEFELRWQPQVCLSTGRIVGAEALLRWNHPERGLLAPGAFLGAAEETGLMTPITAWVLRAACRQGAAWARRPGGGVRVSANISPSLFRQADVRGMVAAALEEAGLAPATLDLELTERVPMDDLEKVAATLRELRELGVCLSIDDFGVGYSSLLYVKSFPVQRLKIDRSFVAELPGNAVDAAIVAGVVSLGRNLGMRVVAEGIETEAQLEAVRRLGCDEIQGFFVSHPITAAALERRLAGAEAPVPGT
ncbi:EAL domain-containing protein [Roseococcus sp. SYP-B2431]|uniref:EAL domain-containing response regulator n=1 Tax=Roseococcus sp. SYP-B2431 TaxID=2496640 RepID=UPI00103EF3D2|nr:EAL domain-containing protein [Roseococcus sp. SYP-B2431]TCH99655.1 EAL domain-containing protein [Roseococcus sp. SYP-B2431]